jgi:hypothetical protein
MKKNFESVENYLMGSDIIYVRKKELQSFLKVIRNFINTH